MGFLNPAGRKVALLAVLALASLTAACAPTAAPAQPTTPPAPPTAVPKPTAVPQAPAATSNLFVTADIVQGTKNLPKDQMAAKTCVVSSRYPRNAELVFRARVEDPRTGKALDDKALSNVEVRLGDGKTTLKTKYGKHGDDSFWSTAWIIPKDFPTGTLNYSVVATSSDGRTGEFKPFNVTPSLLTVTSEVLPDVQAPPKKS